MSKASALQKIEKEKKLRTGILNLNWENLTELPEEILDLTHLKILDLRSNLISDISLLERLVDLKTLDLRFNQVSDIEPLEKLFKLQTLDISSNQVSDVSFIEGLSNLQVLNISSNQISSVSFLKSLTQLKTLNLRSNQILDIQCLNELTKLQILDIQSNQVSDISSLEGLTHLQTLDLSANNISDLSALKSLINLKTLDLKSNNISSIEPLLPLITLNEIEVSFNNDDFKHKLNLKDNPIFNPPIEIISQGNKAISNYYNEVSQHGAEHLYEAKVIIVGEGGAGKTSLAWKMKGLNNAMPNEGNDRTRGIDIQSIIIKNIREENKPFLMNVWDFGGQGYYHSTHQFFLTKRSLYVIVNNTRINKTDFNSWLQTISLFSDNSPVIIVENEVGGAKSELDLRGLQQHFDNIKSLSVVDLSNTEDGRLEKLIEDIQFQIQRLPHVGSELPKQWVKIREELAEVAKSEAHITDSTFYKICKKHQVTERDAIKRLGDLFHDLGIFLHFREDEILRRTVILQNTWAIKGVYEILDSALVREQKGYFTIEQAESIWDNTEFEDMHHELVRLMTKFELCCRIPYTNAPVAYISPNLLPIEKPEYDWNTYQNLIIYYQYEFMPKGLLGRLIVRLHRHVKDIQNMAWRNGCVFEYEETEAQVVETYGLKKLEIRLQGKHCVRLSSIIIREIDELNESFKRIKVKKLFPCNCGTCLKLEQPHFYDYDNLMNRKAKGKQTIECDISFVDADVDSILGLSVPKINLLKCFVNSDFLLSNETEIREKFRASNIMLINDENEVVNFYIIEVGNNNAINISSLNEVLLICKEENFSIELVEKYPNFRLLTFNKNPIELINNIINWVKSIDIRSKNESDYLKLSKSKHHNE